MSLHGCSSKVQPLLLILDKGYLFTATPPDLEHGIAPLGPPALSQPLLLGHGVSPPDHFPWLWVWGTSSRPLPQARGSSSRLPPLTLDTCSSSRPPPLGHEVLPASAPDLGYGVAPLSSTMCAVAAAHAIQYTIEIKYTNAYVWNLERQ